ncbi:MAG: hypothetical protein AAF556_11700, partial [Pseudomonadota bacterium]
GEGRSVNTSNIDLPTNAVGALELNISLPNQHGYPSLGYLAPGYLAPGYLAPGYLALGYLSVGHIAFDDVRNRRLESRLVLADARDPFFQCRETAGPALNQN